MRATVISQHGDKWPGGACSSRKDLTCALELVLCGFVSPCKTHIYMEEISPAKVQDSEAPHSPAIIECIGAGTEVVWAAFCGQHAPPLSIIKWFLQQASQMPFPITSVFAFSYVY